MYRARTLLCLSIDGLRVANVLFRFAEVFFIQVCRGQREKTLLSMFACWAVLSLLKVLD